MRIGSSIGLIAVGLILALAVHVRLGVIDIALVGCLVVVGIIGLLVSLSIARRSRMVVTRDPDDFPRRW